MIVVVWFGLDVKLLRCTVGIVFTEKQMSELVYIVGVFLARFRDCYGSSG